MGTRRLLTATLSGGDISGLADGTLYLACRYARRSARLQAVLRAQVIYRAVRRFTRTIRPRHEQQGLQQGRLAEILEDIMGKGLTPDPVTWTSRRRAIVPAFPSDGWGG